MLFLNTIATIEMFSFEHNIAMLVSFVFILAIFLLRNVFIKHEMLDKIFRYSLAILMVTLEAIYYVKSGRVSYTFAKMIPLALCTYSEICTVILLISNSKRICKLIFPFAMCGALLSVVCVSCEQNFPSFRAFHYFIGHVGFMTANLYFIFTKKVNKYTYKDFSNSCLVLLIISSMMIVLNALGVNDDMFLLSPPSGLSGAKDVLGQIGYSMLFPILVTLIMATTSFLAYLSTRKRDDIEEINPSFKKNIKLFDLINQIPSYIRHYAYVVTICVFVFITTIQAITNNFVLFVISCILCGLISLGIILNEVLNNYNTYYINKK